MIEPESYVLVTPAKNEEQFIEATLRSVIAQTIQPARWIVVSDGSTDRTDEIVSDYARNNAFIRLIRITRDGPANFAAKVAAFKAGHATLSSVRYGFLGNLDADVSFDPTYYEKLLGYFRADSTLGLAGGIILELIKKQYVSQTNSVNSVAGAVQLFRRRCFDDIGGYLPLRSGSIDAAAEIMARACAWNVRTFRDLPVLHHRRVRIGARNVWSARIRQGANNYRLGYHPAFQLASSIYRMAEAPYIIGGILNLAGYVWAHCTGVKVVLPETAVRYLRSEQIERLYGKRRALHQVQHDVGAENPAGMEKVRGVEV